ncbi:MAG: nodulation protein NodZ [Pseudomonadota bacterium]|nr:nodulation protein NodZ [Pseudomonadota bacterium]
MNAQTNIPDTDQGALIIKAKGGLGNRMLSAITGLVLADLNGRAGYVDWRDGMYLEPGENLYPLLFDASWMADLSAYDGEKDVKPDVWSGRLTDQPVDIIRQNFPNQHQNPFLYRRLSIGLTDKDPGTKAGVFWSYLPKMQRLSSRLSRDPRFKGRSMDEIMRDYLDRYFKPVPEVTARIDEVFAKLRAPVIGVHIRFTDRKVPLGKIIRELEKLVARMPEATIFLATDSAQAQDAILGKFENVVTLEKAMAADGAALHFSTDSFTDPVTEARNALADMMALARCDYLLHSRHSTFSVTAALIGHITEDRQVDIAKYDPKVRFKQFVQART